MSLPAARFLDRTTPPHIVTLMLLAGLSAMSMNVFLPSLPSMAAWFDAPYATVQLSVSLYLALSGVLQLVIGPLADRFGRRPVLIGALGVFVLATLGTLLAPTIEIFLVFRMMQAVVAASFALSRAVVRDMVPAAQAAAMIGYVTMGMSLVPMFAPAAGGVLDETFGWQANFVLLFVLGLAMLALAWADLGETSTTRYASMTAQMRAYPALLRSRRFWGYAINAAATSGLFFAFLGGAPIVGTNAYGLSPTQLGLWFATPGIGYLLGNFLTGRLSGRLGIERMVISGTLLLCAAIGTMLALMLIGLDGPVVFFGLMTVIGLSNGLVMPSANAGMMSVRPDLAGSASGLGGFLMVGGGAALAALAGVVLGDGTSALPLVILQAVSAAVSLVAILWVIRRKRQLGL